MADYHTAYLVTLDEDIREEDAQPILAAIRQLRFVAAAEPVISEPGQQAAATRMDLAWKARLLDLIDRSA